LADRFSIIIVHRNGPETLLRTLDALAVAIDPAHDEIFITDNGSSDDSLARARDAHPAVRIIENGCNMGYAAAINQAVPLSNSQYLLFLNNDAFVAPGLFDRFSTLFDENPRAGIIGPLLISEAGDPQRCFGIEPTFAGEAGLHRSERRRPPLPAAEVAPADWISGACMAARCAATAEAGSIDSGFFFYYEDVEFSIRLRRAGWLALLDQGSRVVHEMGTSTKPVRLGSQIEHLRSHLRFYRRIFSPREAIALTAIRMFRLAVNTAACLLLTVLTLGLVGSIRRKFQVYGCQLAWALAGMPNSWGLPDKCGLRALAAAGD
jgi:GT2 family glycosyltransferase